MEKPDVDWEAVWIAYDAHDCTQKALQERFGITEGQLRHRKKKENWAKRSARPVERSTVIQTMMRVLERQVSRLDSQRGEPLDKQTMLLGTMTKTMEKLMELEKADVAQRPVKKDLTALRAKVAKRIEQLSAQQNNVG